MKFTKDITAEDIYYEYFFNREDIVSTIFNTLGWFYTRPWSAQGGAITNTIIRLTETCLKEIKKGKKFSDCGGGGLLVELWVEEDEIFGDLLIEIT